MIRFIVLTFAFMGLGFYELSGGSDFEPASWREVSAPKLETEALKDVNVPEDVIVTAKVQVPELGTGSKHKRDTEAVPAGSPVVVFSSVPITHRLAGDANPTPIAQQTALGPDPTLITEPQVTNDFPAKFTFEVEDTPDFRRVTGNRVNMRNGPGTQYSIVGKLLRDDEVEILQDPGAGWVKLQVMETGRVGWMSAKLLTKVRF